ncbi:His/Gly/Thr/Pro-type tRNA ligase C-terminal domain-containing protein [Komagataeibacter medellinensis]|uniref:His/Gly/Thr/Pro-type tRNA ligase C-terminal domain-containing protein n=1 Tax=Komagataeibacter medellinensis TaxID=1177712 RepID=UPI001E2A5E6A|nr:His/Gly/Thr/Pro-type tRNA ligase C-terminal domain-containing protein [Komagataeibacter medellinensis]
MAYKIREHSLAKVPVLLIVGKKEAQAGTVSIREYGNPDAPTIAMETAINLLADASRSRLLQVFGT